jgi:hypothetical protein
VKKNYASIKIAGFAFLLLLSNLCFSQDNVPWGKNLVCSPRSDMSQKLLDDTGNTAFPFKLILSRGNASVDLSFGKFVLDFEGNAGDPNERLGVYRRRNNPELMLHYGYKANVAVLFLNSEIRSVAICK